MARAKDEIERIGLSKEQKEAMVASLQRYFEEERDEEMGHLAAELLLRHILREIAPHIYNAGVGAAGRCMMQRIDDMADIEMSTTDWR